MSDLSKKDQRALLKAYERMRQDEEIRQQKREDKLWANVEVPVTLKNFLTALTKEELSEIRRNLEIDGISSLKKQQLIEILVPQIIENSRSRFLLFDDEQYKLFKGIANNGGWTDKVTVSQEKIIYYRSRGLLFPGRIKGQKAMIMPEELVGIFRKIDNKEFSKIIKRNDEWVRLTHGLLYYYGTLDIVLLKLMIEDYTGVDKLEIEDFVGVILEAAEYFDEIRVEPGRLSNYRVFEPDQVQQEHSMRPDVAFYPFSYDQIFQAGLPDFVEKNSAFKRLSNFIKVNYDISLKESDALVEECVFAIRIGEPLGSILDFLQENLEIEDLEMSNQFADHLAFLHNNTRQWFLKGYSPSELTKSPQLKSNVVDIQQYRNKVKKNESKK